MRIGELWILHSDFASRRVHEFHEISQIHVDIVFVVGQIDAFDFFLGRINKYIEAPHLILCPRSTEWLQGSQLTDSLRRCRSEASVHKVGHGRWAIKRVADWRGCR